MDLNLRYQHIKLYETYKDLLTEKQQAYFEAYYYDDLSLAEIALKCEVSRNAVFDQINKTINTLTHYEEKLKVVKKEEKLYQLLENLDEKNALALKQILEEE